MSSKSLLNNNEHLASVLVLNKTNKGNIMKKSFAKKSLVINDLPSMSGENEFLLSSNFGILVSRKHYFEDYTAENEDGEEEECGADTHKIDFALKQEQILKEEAAIKAGVILDELKTTIKKTTDEKKKAKLQELFNTLKTSPDALIAYAEQRVCVEEAPNAFSKKEQPTTVTLLLKRLSTKGNWYTLTDEESEDYKPVFEITMNVHDIFDVDGNVLTLKKVPAEVKTGRKGKNARRHGKMISIIEAIMKKNFIELEHVYYYVDQDGKMVFVRQPQALQIKGGFFKAGMVVEGVRLQSTVAPFFKTVESATKLAKAETDIVRKVPRLVKDKIVMVEEVIPAGTEYRLTKVLSPEVVEDLSYFGWDNVTEINPHLLIIPSSVDESNGDAGDTEFNDGILCGTNEATQAMMSDDLAEEAIREKAKEEARQKKEGNKVRRQLLGKKAVKENKDQSVLNTEIGRFVTELAPLTYVALKNRKVEIEVMMKLNNYADKMEEVKAACEALLRSTGKGVELSVFKTIERMINIQKNKKFAAMVDSHILENIANINNGSLDIKDIDDDSLIEIRETSVKHGWDKEAKKPTAAWIADANKSNEIKARYNAIKGLQGEAPAKPRNGKVTKVKVA